MGRITLPHRGSKCALKKRYVKLDLKYSIYNMNYILLQIRAVPKKTALAGLILYKNGLFSYILIENSVKIGTIWFSEYFRNYKMGDYFKLNRMPFGCSIFNVELKLGYGGQIARSAGTSVKILTKFPNKYNKILLKFRSGEEYFVNGNCIATIGVCSNKNHWKKQIGSAGKNRLFGFRSHVRGVAMNPVDHPHGGNTNGGRPCMTPYGLLTKGVPTRHNVISKLVIHKRKPRRIDCFVKVKRYTVSKN